METVLGIFFTHFAQQTIWGLAGNHKAVRFFTISLLKRNNEVAVHLRDWNSVRFIDKWNDLFKLARVEIWQTQNFRPLASSALFIISSFTLYFLFVHMPT